MALRQDGRGRQRPTSTNMRQLSLRLSAPEPRLGVDFVFETCAKRKSLSAAPTGRNHRRHLLRALDIYESLDKPRVAISRSK